MTDREFEQYATTYGPTLFRVAYHALASRPDAEDVVQTVLLKLFESDTDFASEEHVKHWLIRLTVNESRRALRAPWRRRTVPLEDYDRPTEDTAEPGEVLSAVMALPRKYRLPIYLYYYEELSIREMAAALGEKESTLQTRLQRARKLLKLSLNSDETEETGYV